MLFDIYNVANLCTIVMFRTGKTLQTFGRAFALKVGVEKGHLLTSPRSADYILIVPQWIHKIASGSDPYRCNSNNRQKSNHVAKLLSFLNPLCDFDILNNDILPLLVYMISKFATMKTFQIIGFLTMTRLNGLLGSDKQGVLNQKGIFTLTIFDCLLASD